MHQKRITQGLVVGKRGVGEANALAYLLTQDLGLVRAKALSARSELSKLRYGLEPLTMARYTLVQGRQEWRLTGVDEVSREFIKVSLPRRAAMGRICKLLLRLIRGEEVSPKLFSVVEKGLRALAHAEHTESIEVVLVLRILSELGYLPHSEALAPYIEGDFIELSAKALQSRALLVRTINESLHASGL